jgi:regulator of RNase E activity RraB
MRCEEDEFVEWAVLATRIEALSPDELDAVTRLMEELAATYDGTYDGWGTPLGD